MSSFLCASIIPANIRWSSRSLEDTSWRRLQHVFSVTIFCFPRRFQDVLKASWRLLSKTSWKHLTRHLEDVLKTSWKTKNCCAQDIFKTFWRHVLKTYWRHVLKTYWRHVLKTSSRRLGDKQIVNWEYLYLTNLNVYLTNLYLTSLYLTILRRIQNALIRIHYFRYSSYFETQAAFLFEELKYLKSVTDQVRQ